MHCLCVHVGGVVSLLQQEGCQVFISVVHLARYDTS